MVGKRQRKIKRLEKNNRRDRREFGPGDNASGYLGPVSVPRGPRQADTVVRTCTLMVSPVATLAVWAQSFSSDPTSATDWSQINTAYDEYRVLALRVQFTPRNRYNNTLSVANAGVIGVGVVAEDLNNTTTFTTMQQAGEHASARLINGADPWEATVHAQGKNLMTWNPTSGGPTYFMAVKVYTDGWTSGITTFGVVMVRWLVQFRGTS